MRTLRTLCELTCWETSRQNDGFSDTPLWYHCRWDGAYTAKSGLGRSGSLLGGLAGLVGAWKERLAMALWAQKERTRFLLQHLSHTLDGAGGVLRGHGRWSFVEVGVRG